MALEHPTSKKSGTDSIVLYVPTIEKEINVTPITTVKKILSRKSTIGRK